MTVRMTHCGACSTPADLCMSLWAGNGVDDAHCTGRSMGYICELEVCPVGRYFNGGAGAASCTDCPPWTYGLVSGRLLTGPGVCLPACPVFSQLSEV